MKKIFLFFVGLLVLVSFVTCCAYPKKVQLEPLEDQTYPLKGKEAYRSVVKFQAEVKREIPLPGASTTVTYVATGFAIDKEHIVTAGHYCISVLNAYVNKTLVGEIEIVYLNNNDELETKPGVNILYVDEKPDICVVKKKKHGLLPMKLAKYKNLRVGDKVRTIGSPLGIFPTETEGYVISTKHEDRNPELRYKLFTSIPVFGGNSGGPVLNEAGEVVGMVVMSTTRYEHISISATAWQIRKFLRENLGKTY